MMVLAQYSQGIPIFPIFPKNSDKSKLNFIFMEKITFNHYKNAIQEHYEIKKKDDVTGILLNPTPAQLRTYCSLTVDKGITSQDEEIFRNFFETKSNESLKKSIDNCNTDKFKTIISFLKDKRDSEISLRVELSAILIDFKPRPYNKYNNLGNLTKSDNVDSTSNSFTEISENGEDKKNLVVLTNESDVGANNKKKRLKRKILIGIVSLIGFSSIGFTVKNTLFKNKECIQWQKNHYEVVDCTNKNQQSLIKQYDIIPFDENQSKLIKIEVSDTTTFFKNEKSLYWYCKVNGKPEFFNTHGIHPESGKALRPVTQYIVDKYVK